jgi:hypothetical protein
MDAAMNVTDTNGEHVAMTLRWGWAVTTGDEAHAVTAGDEACATTFGEDAHASTTGEYSHAAAFGNRAHATAVGNYSNASALGEGGRAVALGRGGIARCGPGGSITLAHDGTVRTFYAGSQIAAGVFFTLDPHVGLVAAETLAGWDLEGRLLTRDGDLIHLNGRLYPHHDEELVGVAADVVARHLAGCQR